MAQLGAFLKVPAALDINIIERESQLIACWEDAKVEGFVGLDAEWCPVSKELALLQVATSRRVYLIDFVACGTGSVVEEFIQSLLEDANIVKIAYSFLSDLMQLSRTFPVISKAASVCDVSDALPARRKGGLSALSAAVLGHPIDKALQASAWRTRPLSPEQVLYAALDAWVLVALHKALTDYGIVKDADNTGGLHNECVALVYRGQSHPSAISSTAREDSGSNVPKSGGEYPTWTDLDGTSGLVTATELITELIDSPAITNPSNAPTTNLLRSETGGATTTINQSANNDVNLNGSPSITLPCIICLVKICGASLPTLRMIDVTDAKTKAGGSREESPFGQPRSRLQEALRRQSVEDVAQLRALMGSRPRFVADTMATGLCKELRRFGFDCQLLNPSGDRELEWRLLVETAQSETRVILTRDTSFFMRKLSRLTYFVRADKKKDQFEEVRRSFGLRVDGEKVMSRCSKCNHELSDVWLTANEIGSRVPEKTRQAYDKFWECSNSQCAKVYWMGYAWDRSLEEMQGRIQAMRLDA